MNKFILKGVKGLKLAMPPGRPAKLTKKEKTELKRLVFKGPKYAGARSMLAKPDAKVRLFGPFGSTTSAKVQ